MDWNSTFVNNAMKSNIMASNLKDDTPKKKKEKKKSQLQSLDSSTTCKNAYLNKSLF